MELFTCAPESSLLKTWRDFLAPKCQTGAASSATASRDWKPYITKLRLAYSVRAKLALLTRGSGSSSSAWPTISVNEAKNSVGKSQLGRNSVPLGTMAAMQEDWRSLGACSPNSLRGTGQHPDVRRAAGHQVNLQDQMVVHGNPEQWRTPAVADSDRGAHPTPDTKAGEHSLVTQVANWPTPNTCPDAPNGGLNRGGGKIRARNKSQCLGLLAQESGSTHGNRPESWPTPTLNGNTNNAQSSEKAGDGLSTAAKMRATPEGMAGGKTSRGGNRKGELLLTGQVKAWATPRAEDAESAESAERKRELGRTNSGGGDLQAAVQGDPKVILLGQVNPSTVLSAGKLNSDWVCTLMNVPVKWVRP